MCDEDGDNLQNLETCMDNDFCSLVTEFYHITFKVWDLLSEEEKNADKTSWVEPKKLTITQFAENVRKWMDDVSKSKKEEAHVTVKDYVNDDYP